MECRGVLSSFCCHCIVTISMWFSFIVMSLQTQRLRECPASGSKVCVTALEIARSVCVAPSAGSVSTTRMLKTSASPGSSTRSWPASCPVCPCSSWDRRPGRDTTLRWVKGPEMCGVWGWYFTVYRAPPVTMLLPQSAVVPVFCARSDYKALNHNFQRRE